MSSELCTPVRSGDVRLDGKAVYCLPQKIMDRMYEATVEKPVTITLCGVRADKCQIICVVRHPSISAIAVCAN